MPKKRLLGELREALARLVEGVQQYTREEEASTHAHSCAALTREGEPVTLSSVAKEAQGIIKRTEGRIDWGIDSEDYTSAIAVDLLHELVEMRV